MKIRYIVSMSGASQTFPAFEKDNKGDWVYYEVDELEAVNLINAEYAVAKNDKEAKEAIAKIETLKADRIKAKKMADDIENLDKLKERAANLQAELSEVTAQIEAVESVLKGK